MTGPPLPFWRAMSILLLCATVCRASDEVRAETCSEDGAFEEGEFVGCNMPRYVADADPHNAALGESSVGYHLLCVRQAAGEEGRLSVRAWKDSRVAAVDFKFARPEGTAFAPAFVAALREAIGAPRVANQWGHEQYRQPMALFEAATRRRLTTEAAVLAATGGVFAIEGGQFIYPGVRVGFTQRLSGVLPGLSESIEVETLSLRPAVFSIRHFLLPAECDHIRKESEPSMGDSGVVLMDKDIGKPSSEWRTSTQTWLSSRHDVVAQALDSRISNLTGVALEHFEDVQVLRYMKSQFYDHHIDAFDPKDYKSQEQVYEYGHKNRLATVFWYLTDVEQGGETAFPRAGGIGHPATNKGCNVAQHWAGKGLKVSSEKGKVIIFYSLLPTGDIDQYSLHGGCPVFKGTKWAANKWMWNKVSGYYTGPGV